MSKVLTPGEVRELGEATWLLAQEYASKNGLGVTKKGKSGNLVTVNGGVSKFIKDAAKEINLLAYVKGKNGSEERRRVREFLKEGFNVVVIGKGDGQYQWRLFVADDWSKDGTVAQHPTILSRATKADIDRLTDGESGPVETVKLWEEFQTNPIGEVQARILKWLYENGGRYGDESGFALTDVLPGASEGDSNAGSFKAMMDRGLTKRQMKNSRRWAVAALTERGWWAAERLSYIQTAEVALSRFLSTVGSFEGTSPSRTVSEIAERVHKNRSEVGKVLNDMEEKGWVELYRDSENGPYRRIKWVAANIELPGVHIYDTKATDKVAVSVAPDAPVAVENGAPAASTSARVTPPTPQPVASITRQQVDEVIDLLVAAAGSGVDPDVHKKYKDTLGRVFSMCKNVEAGKTSALRAITEIMELTEEVLS